MADSLSAPPAADPDGAHGPRAVDGRLPTLTAAPGYRPDIDGLRAIAVLLVLAFHAFPRALPGGFVGVDVFFVVSGYLITGILLDALGRQRLSVAGFYARRVRRIFPALAVVLGACWAFGWLALFPDEYRQLGRHVAGGAGFVANLYFWSEAGYFDNAAATKPLLHLWSLGIEEQFYIVWPLLLALAWRLRLDLVRWMAALAFASFAASVITLDSDPAAAFYSPLTRAWELALGGLLAAWAARARLRGAGPLDVTGAGRRSRGRQALAAVGLTLVVLAAVILEEGRTFPGWWALLPTLGTAAVLAAGPAATVNRKLLSTRALVGIGLVSYPLYLWHWPLLSFARIVESKTPAAGVRLAALAAAGALATVTYLVVERRFRFGGDGRRKVAVLAGAMIALFVAGRVVVASHGHPERRAVRVQAGHQRALGVPDYTSNSRACMERYGFDDPYRVCLLDDPAAEPTVALVGDSHGHHLYSGLAEHYRERGENLIYLSTRRPFWGVPHPRWDHWQRVTDSMLDTALAAPRVHTVIIASAYKLDDRSRKGRRLLRLYRETLRRFLASGRRVLVFNDVPKLPFDPRECIRRAVIAGSATRSPCSFPRATFEQRTAVHERELAALLAEFPQVERFDPAPYFCDATSCWAILDGKLLYRDRDHLSLDGDRWLGEKFSARTLARDAAGRAAPL